MSRYNKGDRVFHVRVYTDKYDKNIQIDIQEKVIIATAFHNKVVPAWVYEESKKYSEYTGDIDEVHNDFLFTGLPQAIDYARYRLHKIRYEDFE